jgi:hypothetical protein
VIFWRLGFQLDFGGNADTNREGGRGERESGVELTGQLARALSAQAFFAVSGTRRKTIPAGRGPHVSV